MSNIDTSAAGLSAIAHELETFPGDGVMAGAIEALRALAAEKEAMEQVAIWLEAALKCPGFDWDADQRDMANEALSAYRGATPQLAAPSDAELVMAALDSGEWSLMRHLPDKRLTDAANKANAWSVRREIPPYCTDTGIHQWSGPTAIETLRKAQKELNLNGILPVPEAPSDAGFQVSINGGQWTGPEETVVTGNSVTLTVEPSDAGGEPEGWVPLTITFEEGYPEEVAYGPKRMMDRLKKWLDKFYALRLAAAPEAPQPTIWIDASDLRQVANGNIMRCHCAPENDGTLVGLSVVSQPAVRGPLNENEMLEAFGVAAGLPTHTGFSYFRDGVRFAERAHGIAGTQGGEAP